MRERLVVGMMMVGMALATPAGAFDPTKYAGTWSGTWKNRTFKVEGPMSATVTLPGADSVAIDWSITGLFNCGAAGGSRTLTSGVEYTDAGLDFTAQNAAWGDAAVTSVTKKKLEKVSLSGTTPCNASIQSWSVKAKLKDATLKGKMKIVFAAGSPKRARTTFSLTKTPLIQ
jgi:hypothetical protein